MKKPIKRVSVRKNCACVSPVPPTLEQQLEWERQSRQNAEGRASAFRDAIELFTGHGASSSGNSVGRVSRPSY